MDVSNGELTKSFEEFDLKRVPNFKFGGGWFNLLSTKLLQLTDMPDSFGPYGVDDLYVMLCCNILLNKGYKIQQYVIENKLVTALQIASFLILLNLLIFPKVS